MRVKELIEKASFLNADDFSALTDEVNVILEREREEGKTGEQTIRGGLVWLPLKGKALLVGDLHGDLESLASILIKSGFVEGESENPTYLVFLGDYGDRGQESVEVYSLILNLKNFFRKRVVLLRGNHEGPRDLKAHPHDLPYFLRARYGDKGKEIYAHLQELFNRLHHSVIVEGKYLILHGGLPQGINSVDEIAYAHQTHPRKKCLEEILWSDPGESKESYPSPRGAGRIFGENLTMDVLTKLGVRTLIRSHQSCEGVSVKQNGKVLTLFSRKGPPYYNSQAAYLEVALSEKAKSGYELAKEAHFF